VVGGGEARERVGVGGRGSPVPLGAPPVCASGL
jgi:hypothetical protein